MLSAIGQIPPMPGFYSDSFALEIETEQRLERFIFP